MKQQTKPGMKRSRTPWSVKLRPDMQPAVTRDPKGRGQMLLPTPMLVADEISSIPAGALCTVSELRARLASRFRADVTCPLMTGIFYNLVAGAAEEQLVAGKPPLAPYWRVVRDDGTLSPKTPDGPERQAEHLREEGHAIKRSGAKFRVPAFEQRRAGGSIKG
jgi:hypothetical protein